MPDVDAHDEYSEPRRFAGPNPALLNGVAIVGKDDKETHVVTAVRDPRSAALMRNAGVPFVLIS